MTLPSNEKIRSYTFLREMERDTYFPNVLVKKGQQLLIDLCLEIERVKPVTTAALLDLTHATTQAFNDLEEEFEEQGSQLETVARDCIGSDFAFIAATYGFDVDVEELISNRDW
ncbi:unnamed protein product [Aphanomyces euteiches]|uniref:Uncharacterized protein n=1 Tax=Aphanomyces euteiches TaxID=100861 RepID=A0A6G0X6I2_9STRA|nr:hypothetical protein Ae201684_007935 [Aphanomyces euteiches]KAH9074613.1 hypothetical protein Ae201684P_022415 [Aphanomyces euteiches]KAH9143219.1 hypothetical protein AeRB84_012756 [Aphanomyces euteiches]